MDHRTTSIDAPLNGHPGTVSAAAFDSIYGDGMWMRVGLLINDLAPVTRRDSWWVTDGPYEIIAQHLAKASGLRGDRSQADANSAGEVNQ